MFVNSGHAKCTLVWCQRNRVEVDAMVADDGWWRQCVAARCLDARNAGPPHAGNHLPDAPRDDCL